jgi:hypothetical protein
LPNVCIRDFNWSLTNFISLSSLVFCSLSSFRSSFLSNVPEPSWARSTGFENVSWNLIAFPVSSKLFSFSLLSKAGVSPASLLSLDKRTMGLSLAVGFLIIYSNPIFKKSITNLAFDSINFGSLAEFIKSSTEICFFMFNCVWNTAVIILSRWECSIVRRGPLQSNEIKKADSFAL